ARIFGARIRDAILGDRAGMWIELADIALKNRRKPDTAILIGDHPVWPRNRRFQRELLKLPCLQVQASKLVGLLFGHPKGIVGAHGRIMGARMWGRNVVLFD